MRNVENYYSSLGIKPSEWLQEDIRMDNNKAISYIEYAIKHLLEIKGCKDLLAEIAKINNKNDRQAEQTYHNAIMEFHAIYFVRRVLRFKVLAVESKTNKIFSPHRNGEKSCDILAERGRRKYYFESKDASSEITSSYQFKGTDYFTPLMDSDSLKWIRRKLKMADNKGADYLICRLPNWTDKTSFPERWVKSIFQSANPVSTKAYKVLLPKNVRFRSLKGAYLIKPYGYAKIIFI